MKHAIFSHKTFFFVSTSLHYPVRVFLWRYLRLLGLTIGHRFHSLVCWSIKEGLYSPCHVSILSHFIVKYDKYTLTFYLDSIYNCTLILLFSQARHIMKTPFSLVSLSALASGLLMMATSPASVQASGFYESLDNHDNFIVAH